MTKTVHLHIERLVLRGVPAAQRAAYVQRFEAGLAQALAQPGAAEAWAAAGHQAGVRTAVPAAAQEPAAAAAALAQLPQARRRSGP